MARRYDSGTTTFSPEGRLYQVEYAIAAIQNAAAAVGIVAKDGVVICGEKKVTSKLLAPPKSSEKMYKIDDHVTAAVAGLTADANILISYARLCAQQYLYTYDEPQPVEALVQLIADYKHAYTQRGGLRPFGCAFLFAGWDRHYGYQLFQTDPSGNFSGWKATAIGSGSATAVSTLKTDYMADMPLADAVKMAVKVLAKALDTAHPTSDRIEVTTLTRDEATGRISQTPLGAAEVDRILADVLPASGAEGAAGAGNTASASM